MANWTDLVLGYLAQRLPQSTDELLERAIEAAPRDDIRQFLRSYRGLEIKGLRQLTDSLPRLFTSEALDLQSRLEDAREKAVVRLLELDGLSPLPYAYLHFPAHEARESLDMGVDAAGRAVQISRDLGHQGAVAFFLTVKGQCLYEKRLKPPDLEQAIEVLEEAKDIYEKELANDKVYAPFGGITRLHLMRARREQFIYPRACRSGERAVELLKRGAATTHAFQDLLAMAERNLASVLRETGNLDRAMDMCQRALDRLEERKELLERDGQSFRNDRFGRDEYIAQIALSYITHASINVKAARVLELRDKKRVGTAPPSPEKQETKDRLFKRLSDAERNLERAEAAIAQFSATTSNPFVGGSAMLHYTRGHIYDMHRNPGKALEEFQKAFNLWEDSPSLFLGGDKRYAAGVLRRMAIVHREQERFSQAHTCFENAAQRYQQLGLPLEEALVQCEWAAMEQSQQCITATEERYRLCVSLCQQGLKKLLEHGNDIIFRWKVHRAHLWLLRQLVNQALRLRQTGQELPQAEQIELLTHLESLRALEGKGLAISEAEEQLRDFVNGTNSVCAELQGNSAAFLWMQADGDQVIFVGWSDGNITIDVAEKELADAFGSMIDMIHALGQTCSKLADEWRFASADDKSDNENRTRLARNIAADGIGSAGAEAFLSLPESIVNFLSQDREIVFLSPCEDTLSWPFELLQGYIHEHYGVESDKGYEDYLGMHIVMPRVHGLLELTTGLLGIQPPSIDQCALIVGDPKHQDGQGELPGADVQAFQRALNRLRVPMVPSGKALVGQAAVRSSLQQALGAPNLWLWFHAGHGFFPDLAETVRVSYLPLAQSERFTLDDLDKTVSSLPGTVVFLDCCHMGVSELTAEGQINGFPSMLLRKGASCVLASAFAVHDDLCEIFSRTLAAAVFDRSNDPHIGRAVIRARQQTFEFLKTLGAPREHLLAWGLITLWGNPFSTLQTSKSETAAREKKNTKQNQ